MTPITQKRPKEDVESNDEPEEKEEICPVCGDPFDNAFLMEHVIVEPEKLDNKHCFEPIGITLAVFEHKSEKEFDDQNAVQIDVK